MSGKVSLVGAGPGDPMLLTRRGLELLEAADCVVYDRLVGRPILDLIPEGAERVNVGKEASRHPVPQGEINRILLERAQAGMSVVRLKGGDPFLFGRGGEELELLAEHGIPFEVVPGVTSALAAPAYGGIPVTHRAFASSLHIVTGHAKAGGALNINFRALAESGGTLVFLMGVTSMGSICRGLLDAGMAPDTPAAMVESGTTPAQRKVVSTLSRMPREAADRGIHPPAVLIVGQVCALSEAFDWFDRLPLKGRAIVVTRPRERCGTLAARLRALGAETVELPCIATVPITPCPDLTQAVRRIGAYRTLVFTSPFGPGLFFDELRRQGMDARALAGLRIAVIGPRTGEAVESHGLRPDIVPQVYDTEHLAPLLTEGPVLICRSQQGSPELTGDLARRGVAFTEVSTYRTESGCRERADIPPGSWVTFTSASTVEGFVHAVPGELLGSVTGFCIGRHTADAARKYGIRVKVAPRATIDDLVELILKEAACS